MDENKRAVVMEKFFNDVERKAYSDSHPMEERLPYVQFIATMEMLTALGEIRELLREGRSLPHEDDIKRHLRDYLFKGFPE